MSLLPWLFLAAWAVILCIGWWKCKDASTDLYNDETEGR